jgi:serine/threonine protein kinase
MRLKHFPVPEPFIWVMLRGLSEGLLALQMGQCYESKITVERKKSWEQIVHSDIKPQNVFLGEPDAVFPCYRTAILADFDTALRKSEMGPGNEIQWGTYPWVAPVRAHHSIKFAGSC